MTHPQHTTEEYSEATPRAQILPHKQHKSADDPGTERGSFTTAGFPTYVTEIPSDFYRKDFSPTLITTYE